jgi:hypothetical protein
VPAFAGAVHVTLADGSTREAVATAPAGLDEAGVRRKAARNAALAGVELTDPTALRAALAAAAPPAAVAAR